MKVFINPGHAPNGYPDPGAISNGVRECDVVANVGNLLANYLTFLVIFLSHFGIRVMMTL